jgi:hypothetical protein
MMAAITLSAGLAAEWCLRSLLDFGSFPKREFEAINLGKTIGIALFGMGGE